MPKAEPIPRYTKTFFDLMILLIATVVLHYLPIGPFGIAAALFIGLAKAVLIALFFMHVKIDHRTVWVFSTIGVFWLFIFFLLTMTDYGTRTWLWVP